MAEQTHWYRAYHLTEDGHIARVELLEATDDVAALRKLETVPNDHGVELWDRARVVSKAEPLARPLAFTPIEVRHPSVGSGGSTPPAPPRRREHPPA